MFQRNVRVVNVNMNVANEPMASQPQWQPYATCLYHLFCMSPAINTPFTFICDVLCIVNMYPPRSVWTWDLMRKAAGGVEKPGNVQV